MRWVVILVGILVMGAILFPLVMAIREYNILRSRDNEESEE